MFPAPAAASPARTPQYTLWNHIACRPARAFYRVDEAVGRSGALNGLQALEKVLVDDTAKIKL